MTETERAIEDIRECGNMTDNLCSSTVNLAIVALQEKAVRENPKPLTCEGCRYKANDGFNYENCIRCKRHWPDRYDYPPKEAQG